MCVCCRVHLQVARKEVAAMVYNTPLIVWAVRALKREMQGSEVSMLPLSLCSAQVQCQFTCLLAREVGCFLGMAILTVCPCLILLPPTAGMQVCLKVCAV